MARRAERIRNGLVLPFLSERDYITMGTTIAESWQRAMSTPQREWEYPLFRNTI